MHIQKWISLLIVSIVVLKIIKFFIEKWKKDTVSWVVLLTFKTPTCKFVELVSCENNSRSCWKPRETYLLLNTEYNDLVQDANIGCETQVA